MPVINVLCDEIPNQAANQHIRWKVLIRLDARDTHQRGQAIRHDFGKRARVFVCDYTRYRPCRGSVFGRKGRAATLEERTAPIALIGARTPQHVFERVDRNQAVQRRFACEETGLAPVFVVGHVTHHPHSARPANKCCEAGVRKRLVMTDRRGIVRKVSAEFAVRHEKSGRKTAEWHKPFRIG